MRFVQLTSSRGLPVWVNFDHVAAVRQGFDDPSGTEILFAVPWRPTARGRDWLASVNVREPLEHVLGAITDRVCLTPDGIPLAIA